MVKATAARVFLGSFFIQASWNFEKMQGLGFAAALSPALDEAFSGEKRKEAYKRHLAFYNAHPYMASPVLGAVINLEENGRGDEGVRLKELVMAPYGAIGDNFFWGSIRPLASSAGVLVAFLLGMWGPVIFLALYNVFHIWMRWNGLKKGYALGEGVVAYVRSLDLPERGAAAKSGAAVLLGALSAIAAMEFLSAFLPDGGFRTALAFAGFFAFLAGAVLMSLPVRRGLTVSKMVYITMLPFILYALLTG